MRSKAWEVALALLQIQELQTAPAAATASAVAQMLVRKTTHVQEQIDKAITGKTSLFYTDEWRGTMKEATIKTNNSNFSVVVVNEEGTLYEQAFSWFQEHESVLDGVAAFEDNGTFVLHFSELDFNGKLSIQIKPSVAMTVSLFYIRVERVVEP